MKYLTPWEIQYGQTDCESEDTRHVVPSRLIKAIILILHRLPGLNIFSSINVT
jgi:hypothetical protein